MFRYVPQAVSSYRVDTSLDERQRDVADRLLTAAGEAINLAILTLEDDASEELSRAEQITRAASARQFLVEAVTALARARILIPAVHTYTVAVITTADSAVEAELARLKQLAVRLLWHNHDLFPKRIRGSLDPEDEAQLAVFCNSLARSARIDRLMEYRWIAISLLLAGLGPVVGAPLLSAYMIVIAVGLTSIRLARAARRATSLG